MPECGVKVLKLVMVLLRVVVVVRFVVIVRVVEVVGLWCSVKEKLSSQSSLLKTSGMIFAIPTSLIYFSFFSLGKAVGGSPWISILISLLVAGVCLSGLLRFTQESREDKLWTPRDSVAQKHKDWVEETFPTERRVSIVLLIAGDVLTPATLKEVDGKLKETNLYQSYEDAN